MVDKVKCGNKECKLFDVVVPVSNLYINRTAPLDGPWPCPECREEMKIAHVTRNDYKPGSSKQLARRTTTQTSRSATKKHVGKKKKVVGIKLKGFGTLLGGRKNVTKKPAQRKQGPRKRA